jgi:hypothetical protein
VKVAAVAVTTAGVTVAVIIIMMKAVAAGTVTIK